MLHAMLAVCGQMPELYVRNWLHHLYFAATALACFTASGSVRLPFPACSTGELS